MTEWLRNLSMFISLVAGIFVANVGLTGFLLPNHFIDGGVTGVSMLVADVSGLPLPIVLVLVNAPFLVLAHRQLGRAFALRSAAAIGGLALALAWIPCPIGTEDRLLGSVFGGFFVGAGVGLAIRGGGVLAGTEILALILSKRTFATVGEVILALNVVIFSFAALTLGLEPALYSVLTYLAATQTINYLLHGIEAYHGVLIVSTRHEAIRQALLTELGRGVTTLHGKGGYTDAEQEILFCVITRLEITRLETIAKAKDAQAFIVVLPVLDTSGGVLKRRAYA